MKYFNFLIIGQGIAGILIGHQLQKRGKSFFVIDHSNPNISSKVAGAIINPYNLKSGEKSFNSDADHLVALNTYEELAVILNIPIIEQKEMILFQEREDDSFPKLLDDEIKSLHQMFHFENAHKISPIFHIYNKNLIENWAAHLQKQNIYENSLFEFPYLNFQNKSIEYKQIKASNIIFCEGVAGKNNPLFNNLPFNKNKGNALILEIPELSESYIYQFKYRLIPMGNHHFWLGSNYQWEFNDLDPDIAWKNSCLAELEKLLKVPFQVKDHLVAERPTTAGQRILMLQHSKYKNCFFFNGLGTKGFTLGPYYAQNFVEKILINSNTTPQ